MGHGCKYVPILEYHVLLTLEILKDIKSICFHPSFDEIATCSMLAQVLLESVYVVLHTMYIIIVLFYDISNMSLLAKLRPHT